MNIVVTRAAEGFARRSFTVAEIRRMVDAGIISEDENFELIDGELVPMSPKGNQHEVIKAALTRIFAVRAPQDLRLGVETSIYLGERTFLEPDLCLYPKQILPESVRGSDVLLAIEVASSSLAYDRGLKAKIYARHGVQELWVIDAMKRETWVHRQPNEDGSWGEIEQIGANAAVSPLVLPDLSIRMAGLD